ncbi:MAG: rhodanese-like domain-containing protein [Myxococcota bacterium]|nr:rhodanese-like domain-containing protein [Myxococcota bacterium]
MSEHEGLEMGTELDHLMPKIGEASADERMLRANWITSLERSPSGFPLHSAEFVARQGRTVRIIDVREADELTGPLGHIPGAEWIPRDCVSALASRLDHDAKLVLVSRAGERSGPLARELEQNGMRFVASMIGGMVAWRSLGFATARDHEILARRDALREESPVAPQEGPLSLEAVREHIGDVRSVRWAKMAALLLHGRVSCVDGRDETGVIGTPGGDSGEMLLALAALERVTGRPLDASTTATLLHRRMDTFGRFYMHTDTHAANELITALRRDGRFDAAIADVREAMQWRRFLTSPPEELRENLLEYLVQPAHVGCGHLKLMMQEHESYGARPALVQSTLRAFHRLRWNGAPEAELTPLPGGHGEGAVVNIRITGELRSFTPIPLVSPKGHGTQMFVNHPQVSELLRRELASFLCAQDDVMSIDASKCAPLFEEMTALAGTQLGHTLGRLAKGLPIYDVTFAPRGEVRVEHVGVVA